MRKGFYAGVVFLLAVAASGQSSRLMAHDNSNNQEWTQERSQRVEIARLSFEAEQLNQSSANLLSSRNNTSDIAADWGHPIYLQSKQGVPTAREPKWPSVPLSAIPKVGQTELRAGDLREQRAKVESRLKSLR